MYIYIYIYIYIYWGGVAAGLQPFKYISSIFKYFFNSPFIAKK